MVLTRTRRKRSGRPARPRRSNAARSVCRQVRAAQGRKSVAGSAFLRLAVAHTPTVLSRARRARTTSVAPAAGLARPAWGTSSAAAPARLLVSATVTQPVPAMLAMAKPSAKSRSAALLASSPHRSAPPPPAVRRGRCAHPSAARQTVVLRSAVREQARLPEACGRRDHAPRGSGQPAAGRYRTRGPHAHRLVPWWARDLRACLCQTARTAPAHWLNLAGGAVREFPS